LKSSKRLVKQVSDINPALDQAMNGLSNSLESNSMNIVLESKTRGQAKAHQALFSRVVHKMRSTVYNSVYNQLLGGGFANVSAFGYLAVTRPEGAL
jgi:hypothetical protein